MAQKTVFISYSQKDKERVSLFASLMTQNGFDVWMDVKKISLGESIVSAISNGLDNSDIYMVFISNNSNQSSWVTEELNIALTKNIETKKPQIVPVLLDNCKIPPILTGRLYLDARDSIQNALKNIKKEFNLSSSLSQKVSSPILSSIVFGLSKETDISTGPFCEGITINDVIENREKIQKLIRRKANGILMNFVPLSDFDLQSPMPKFKNGIYDEYVEKIAGDTSSSVGEKISAFATIFNPDLTKLNELVKNKLDKLLVTSLTYIYSMPSQIKDFDKKCIQKIQNNYSIISYDYEDGATIEYDPNFFLSVKCTLEQIQIKLQTEYAFNFSRKAIDFTLNEFVDWLIN